MNKNYEKRPYMKDEFYQDHLAYPFFLSRLQDLPKNCTEEFEMYDNGEFLTWTVYSDKCEDLLSTLISDLTAYQQEVNEIYNTSSDPKAIEIALMHELYAEVHGHENALYWSSFMQQFLNAEEHGFIHQTNH